ncbi:aspartic proteinase CDR1-like [Pistacia vera]|uniref:aspartic proteinase CDR1-like n=1 Tax=Pistacia vera TaxID=55513 RepID=UPI001262E8FB|nr:aspartic proteinase CDR1-like [Pistacia vera]
MRPFPAATLVLFLYSMIISQLHFTTSKPLGFSLKLIPRDSPESPLYPGNLTQFERIERLVQFSKAKAKLVTLLSTLNATKYDPNFIIPLAIDSYYYIGKITIGTPPKDVLLMIDTGGGLIWTQCAPCINCFPQLYPIYDSQASSSFKTLPCDHPLCQGERSIFQCVNGVCIYSVHYGGAGPTNGVAALESFFFPDDKAGHQIVTIGDLMFGCSYDNRNFEHFNGVISGILGLNLSPDSLFGQLSPIVDSVFSYCIVPFSQGLTSPAILGFGDNIPLPSGNVVTTPYYTVPGTYYYYLHLRDISIGFQRLGFPPETFEFINGGFFIDSGAPLTNLATNTGNGINVYQVVMNALQNHYDSFHLERMTGVTPYGLQLCYRNRAGFRQFPSLSFNLPGGDYIVDAKYVNIAFDAEGYFCVAIIPGEGQSILGIMHQQNVRIIYSAALGAIQFYEADCSNDRI